MFPTEIWEIILNKIDNPIELLRLQQICKHWQFIIRRILITTHKWRELCRQKITNDCELRKILAKTTPNLLYPLHCSVLNDDSLSPRIWEKVYRSLNEWKNTQKNEPVIVSKSMKELFGNYYTDVDEIEIHSVDIWGHIVGVVVSHLEIPETFVDRQYRILFYNINNLEQCIFSINRKYQYVLRIQFWYTDHRLIAIIKDFRKLIFYDIEKQQEIRCDELIIDDYYDTLVNQNQCYFVAGQTVTLLQLKSNGITLGTTVPIPIDANDYDEDDQNHLRHLRATYRAYADEFEVLIDVREGTRKVLKIHRYEANVDDNNDRTLDFAGSNDLYIGDYDRYYTLSCNIKIIVKPDETPRFVMTKGAELAINDLAGILPTGISCVNFYANILIVGTHKGHIHIWYVDEIEDLLKINFKSHKATVIATDNKLIQGIIFTKIGGEPAIFAHTEDNIHIIKFPN